MVVDIYIYIYIYIYILLVKKSKISAAMSKISKKWQNYNYGALAAEFEARIAPILSLQRLC